MDAYCIANNGVIHLVSAVLLPVDENAAVDIDIADLKTMFKGDV